MRIGNTANTLKLDEHVGLSESELFIFAFYPAACQMRI